MDENDDHREHAWANVAARLRDDGWPIVAYDSAEGDWCKACAVRGAIDAADDFRAVNADDVLIVHDADVLVDLGAIREAVAVVASGDAGWAIPHGEVYRLTERATARYYETAEIPEYPDLTRWPYVGVEGGGAVVLRRMVYDDVPLDPRFLGWGDEDVCWGWALRTLHGAPWRAAARLVHLWHPHAAPGAQRSPRWESDHLRRRYQVARDNPVRMRELLDEVS